LGGPTGGGVWHRAATSQVSRYAARCCLSGGVPPRRPGSRARQMTAAGTPVQATL